MNSNYSVQGSNTHNGELNVQLKHSRQRFDLLLLFRGQNFDFLLNGKGEFFLKKNHQKIFSLHGGKIKLN